jgi:hypothetical protein
VSSRSHLTPRQCPQEDLEDQRARHVRRARRLAGDAAYAGAVNSCPLSAIPPTWNDQRSSLPSMSFTQAL